MTTLQEVLLLAITVDVGISIVALFEMIGDYRQNIDIFRMHKKKCLTTLEIRKS